MVEYFRQNYQPWKEYSLRNIITCIHICGTCTKMFYWRAFSLQYFYNDLIISLTNWITKRNWDILEKGIIAEITRTFLAFYGTKPFIIVLTKLRYLILPEDRKIHFTLMQSPFNMYSNIILACALRYLCGSTGQLFLDQTFCILSAKLHLSYMRSQFHRMDIMILVIFGENKVWDFSLFWKLSLQRTSFRTPFRNHTVGFSKARIRTS